MRSADLRSSSITSAMVALLVASRTRPKVSRSDASGVVSGSRSGSHTVKHEPSPSALSTATAPPCSPTSCFTITSPSPDPSNRRESPLSIWLNGLKSWSNPPGEMPMPVSVTVILMNSENISSGTRSDVPLHGPASRPTASRGTREACNVTAPRSRLNLTALASRLYTICLTLRTSTCVAPTSDSTSTRSRIFRLAAFSRMTDRLLVNRADSQTDSRSSVILPASTFERSRMSLMSASRCLPLLKMSPTKRCCASGSSPSRPSPSTSENPMMEFSGVRNS